MKRIMFMILLPILFSSCVKDRCIYNDPSVTASTSEIEYMQSYFASQGITNLIQHPSGVFYTINNPGSGTTPDLCSTILINYNAYRFGYGNPFDSFNEPSGIPFVLGSLIVGVKKVLPLIKPGGSITMYISPTLAYGNQDIKNTSGAVILPANSYIKFDVSLISVSN